MCKKYAKQLNTLALNPHISAAIITKSISELRRKMKRAVGCTIRQPIIELYLH